MAKASRNAATFRLARYAYTFHCIFDKIKRGEGKRNGKEVFF